MIQIDVKERVERENAMLCNLYTGNRCIPIYIGMADYEILIKDGFFLRSGIALESGTCINTTKVYK